MSLFSVFDNGQYIVLCNPLEKLSLLTFSIFSVFFALFLGSMASLLGTPLDIAIFQGSGGTVGREADYEQDII